MKKAKKLSTWFRRAGLHSLGLHRFTEPHFEKHAKLIGSLLLAWNDLHEHLASLFVWVMGQRHWKRSFAIWHAIRSDAGKRRLFREAMVNFSEEELDDTARSRAAKEIGWILDAVNKLEGFRDESAHTPLTYRSIGIFEADNILSMPDIFELQQKVVVPQAGFNNPMALRHHEKQRDLLIEYRYARERIIILRDYIVAIECVLWNPPLPWPDRPSLPDRKPSRRSKGRASRQKKK
jgi:hypothetical protein